jgi:hypothetical protein
VQAQYTPLLCSHALQNNANVARMSISGHVSAVELDCDCHSCARKDLDSAVMTMRAESMISYGLIQIIVLGC